MKLTHSIKQDIKRAARREAGKQRGIKVELGTRADHTEVARVNALLWAPGADLWDTLDLDTTQDLDDDPRLPNCATLDCYVYDERELLFNLYVTIKDGTVIDAHEDDLAHEARAREALGIDFPAYGDHED